MKIKLMKILKSPMLYLFLLFMLDYAFTFYGIHIQAIEEANPVWVGNFAMPLWSSILLRVAYFGILIYLPCEFIRRKKPVYYQWLLRLGYAAYGVMILMHLHWMYVFAL